MKKIIETTITENTRVTKDIYKLIVKADVDGEPGQFVQVRLPSNEFTLRRPLGIATIRNGQLTMFYRIVGQGTQFLSTCKAGDPINILAPLGNNFNVTGEKILLVGGGLGLAPLLFAASKSKAADVVIGGKNIDEALLWEEEFRNLTQKMFTATDDGSYGHNGFVTELLPDILKSMHYDRILVCGPEIMMRKVADIAKEYNIECQVSMEKRMACGLGACLSCSTDTINGRKKICKDGPIFNAEVVFNV